MSEWALCNDFLFNISLERRAREEQQGLMADQVSQATRVWPVQWEPEGWRENQASLEHQVPEVYL